MNAIHRNALALLPWEGHTSEMERNLLGLHNCKKATLFSIETPQSTTSPSLVTLLPERSGIKGSIHTISAENAFFKKNKNFINVCSFPEIY